jgi:hypothetical protein
MDRADTAFLFKRFSLLSPRRRAHLYISPLYYLYFVELFSSLFMSCLGFTCAQDSKTGENTVQCELLILKSLFESTEDLLPYCLQQALDVSQDFGL